MTIGLQRAMAWSGVAFLVMMGAGFVITGLLPPFAPIKSADQVAQFWSTNTGLKRCGLATMLASSGLAAPLGALIAVRIKQIEGRFSPLAYIQLITTAVLVMSVIVPTFVFAAASFRPERDPQITQALNDLGWLLYVMNWPFGTTQCLAIGFAIFSDHRPRPVFPRWLAYFNFWAAFLYVAAGLVVLFKTGPFAWNGILAFWVVASVFGSWLIIMTWQLLATIGASTVVEADQQPRLFAGTAPSE
jgi:hypothetical protein